MRERGLADAGEPIQQRPPAHTGAPSARRPLAQPPGAAHATGPGTA